MLGKQINVYFAENPNFPDSFWSHVKSKSEKPRVKSSKDASWGKLDTSEHSRSSGLQSGKSRRRAAIKRFSTLLAFFRFLRGVCFHLAFSHRLCKHNSKQIHASSNTEKHTHTTQSYLTWKLFWVWSSILSWKQQQHYSAVLSCSRWCFCSGVGRTLDSLSSPCQAQLLIAAQLISVRFRIQILLDG